MSRQQNAEHSATKAKLPQPTRYISSISQLLPSMVSLSTFYLSWLMIVSFQEPHDHDTSTSNESRVISVHQDICCGNKDCIVYSVASLPSSVLPYDDEMLYRALPATEPPASSLTIEVPNFSHVFEVEASCSDFVTISDVLEAIYQNRSHFGKQWFRGLYWAGDKLSLHLHLTDTD